MVKRKCGCNSFRNSNTSNRQTNTRFYDEHAKKKELEPLSIFIEVISERNRSFLDEIDSKVTEEMTDIKPDNLLGPITEKPVSNTIEERLCKIGMALDNKKLLSFKYDNYVTIVKPQLIDQEWLKAKCFLRGIDCKFEIKKMLDLKLRDSLILKTVRENMPSTEKIAYAAENRLLARINYDKEYPYYIHSHSMSSSYRLDSMETVRTIGNIRKSIDTLGKDEIDYFNLNNDYITAFCFLRNERRTFKISRIRSVRILNV